MSYVIYTDSSCDLTPDLLNEWGVKAVSLKFRFEGEDEHCDGDMTGSEFYAQMREGKVSKTAAANPDEFEETFEKALPRGEDVLYIGFSSGLSNTFNSARIAGEALSEKYLERKIVCVDTLGASAGQAMLVYMAVQKKNEGASIEEAAEYVRENILSLCHWFTVDDLVYLKRGGRISATTAFIGGALQIKPVMHMDNEGHLVSVSKVRGRKASIKALADKYFELSKDSEGMYFISHGDCIDDAKLLESMICEKNGKKCSVTVNVGPVIGSHSGPGTLALFFVGKER